MDRLDMLGEEQQFVDHLIPVWKALPAIARGRFMTHFAYVAYARSLGIDAVPRTAEGSNPILVASVHDMKTAMAMGRQRIARMEHGAGQSYAGNPSQPIAHHPSYAGGSGAGAVGLFLCPNEHSANRWQNAYPKAKVAIVGCPKLDEIIPFEHPMGPPIIGVTVHWNWNYLPELMSAFVSYNHSFIDLSQHHKVLGHAHPKDAPMVSRWFAKKDIPYAENLTQVFEKASLLVADNTSALFEFASTGRPVVVLNIPAYRREVNHGLRFDWGTVTNVGVNCDRPQDLLAAVDLALTDPPEQQAAREAALDIVYAYRSGASLRAASALMDWMETAPARMVAPPSRATMTRSERVEAYRATI